MDWEYTRRAMLAVSLVLGFVFLACLNPACVICFYVVAFIIFESVRHPDSVLALQEDIRCARKKEQTRRFVDVLNRSRTEQGEAAAEFEITCETLEPLVFVFTSSAYGVTRAHMEEVCERALPVFGACRYALLQTITEEADAIEYRVAFFKHEAAETAARMEVSYNDIQGIEPRFDAVPVGKFEDGETAFMSFKNRNALIGGLPRMGKSNLLAVLCMGLIRCGKSERLFILSPKILDFQAYENHAYLYAEPEQILKALQGINNEIERRKKYCISHKIKKMPEPTETAPHYVILVDEYAVIKASKTLEDSGKKWRKIGEEIEAELTKIVAQGGFANVQVVITSQRLSSQVIGTDLRELIAGNAVSFANSRQTSTEFIFGEMWEEAPAHEIPVTAQGVAYLYTEGTMPRPRIIKAAHMSDEIEREIIEAIEETRDEGE